MMMMTIEDDADDDDDGDNGGGDETTTKWCWWRRWWWSYNKNMPVWCDMTINCRLGNVYAGSHSLSIYMYEVFDNTGRWNKNKSKRLRVLIYMHIYFFCTCWIPQHPGEKHLNLATHWRHFKKAWRLDISDVINMADKCW